MTHTEKQAAFDSAILAYEDALSDYRLAQKLAVDGEASTDTVDEAREEVVAARGRFEQAERALNG